MISYPPLSIKPEPPKDFRSHKMKSIEMLMELWRTQRYVYLNGPEHKSLTKCFHTQWSSNFEKMCLATIDSGNRNMVLAWLQATKTILGVLESERCPFFFPEELQSQGIEWLRKQLTAPQRDELDRYHQIYEDVFAIFAAEKLRPKIPPRGLNPHLYQKIMLFERLTPLPTVWYQHHFGDLNKKSVQLADIRSRSSTEEILRQENEVLFGCSEENKVLIVRQTRDILLKQLKLESAGECEAVVRACKSRAEFNSACSIAKSESASYRSSFVREAVRMQLEQPGMTGPDLLFFKTGKVLTQPFGPSDHMWPAKELRKLDEGAFFEEFENQRKARLAALDRPEISPSQVRAAGMFMQFANLEAKDSFVRANLSKLIELYRKRPEDLLRLLQYDLDSTIWKGILSNRTDIPLSDSYFYTKQIRLAANELMRLDDIAFMDVRTTLSLGLEQMLDYARAVKNMRILAYGTESALEQHFSEAMRNASPEAICAIVDELCKTVGEQTTMYEIFDSNTPASGLLLCHFLTVNAPIFNHEQKSTLLSIISSIDEHSDKYATATKYSVFELGGKMAVLVKALGGKVETVFKGGPQMCTEGEGDSEHHSDLHALGVLDDEVMNAWHDPYAWERP